MRKPSRLFVATSILFCIVLSACQKPIEPTLPLGPQTLTGSLSPVELSLTRRGTHIIRKNGDDIAYVESSTLNLRSFEGMDVTVDGTLERNTTAAALPVLVAKNITLLTEPSDLILAGRLGNVGRQH